MPDSFSNPPVPGPAAPRRDPLGARMPAIVVCGLIGLSLAAAAAGRIAGPAGVAEGGTPVMVRELRFADRPDGAVVVTDARDGAVIEVLTGQEGFVRSTMRGMARARHRDGLGSAEPFRLTAWRDGRLTLDDAQTGRHIELQAFGETNSAAFARMLGGGRT